MNTNYDCPACGAPNQTGTFCEYCKRRLKEPLISRTVLYGDGVPVMEYEEIMGGDTVRIIERPIKRQEETE